MKKIYADNAATTKTDPYVLKKMLPYFDKIYGNASSLHSLGREAKKVLEESRKVIADSINAVPEEIIFTSGGTESNNIAIKSIAFSNKDKGNHIITTKIEHKSVLNVCSWLESQGFKITYLNVDKEGFIDLNELKSAITEKTILVSIIHGQNEIGTIQDIKAIGEICKKNNVYLHIDACQSYMKTEIDTKKINLDLISLNAHKIHGPKGIGALYIRKGTKIKTWQHGGSQEFNIRTGTENIPGIVGFAEAVKISNLKDIKKISKIRDIIIKKLLKIPHSSINGPLGEKRLCNNINVSFKAIEGEALVEYLDIEGIACSTGSACSSKSLEPSYVIKALGKSHEEANGSIRISISKFTTEKEAEIIANKVNNVVKRLREMSPFKVK